MVLKKRNHLVALLIFVACSTGYLFDVLFLDRHLSAFDIFLEKPSWKVEFGEVRAHNKILADSPTAHYPYKKEFWETTRRGYNTQYLPHIFTGKPTSGQGVGILATSPFQFFMDIPNALDWSTWLRLVLAGLFMYLLLLQLGVGPGASILGGIAWAYNMHQLAWLLFPHHLATELWLPLLLGLNIYILQHRNNVAAALGLVLCTVLFFSSGYTQIVLYTFILIGVFNTLYVLIVQRGAFRERLKTWASVCALYAIAALVLLPDALWQAQEIAEGLRGNQRFRYQHSGLEISLGALGNLFKDLVPNAAEVSRWLMPNYKSEYGLAPNLHGLFNSNTVEVQVYFGMLSLYFCIYGLWRGVTSRDRLLILFAIALFLCIGLMNGNKTLIALMNLVPFGGAGAYSRIVTLILLFAVVLTAFGITFFVTDLKQKRYLHPGIALLLLGSWLAAAEMTHPALVNLMEFMPWLLYLGVFIALAWILTRYKQTMAIVPLAVVLTGLELITSGFSFNTRLPAAQHFPENTIINKLRAAPGDFRTALLMNNVAYHHNIFTYYDLSTIGGYSTVVPNDFLYFMREAFKKIHVTLNGIVFLFDGDLKILRLLNTEYIVSNLDLDSDQIEPVYRNRVETLYRFKQPLSRAYCASDLLVVKKQRNIPDQLVAAAREYDRPVILTEAILGNRKLTDTCKVSGLKVYTSKLTFTVRSEQPTLVFIPVNYHDYWTASINNKSAPLYKANYTFMSVRVPAGVNEVQLEFVNTKLVWGAVLFILLGLAAIIIASLYVRGVWQRTAIAIAALIIIAKSLLSIPGIMNMDIPERTVVTEIGQRSNGA